MVGHATLLCEARAQSGATEHVSIVAVDDAHGTADDAIRTVGGAGFDMGSRSIIGKEDSKEEGLVGSRGTGGRVKAAG
jgi:hypothetical protein